MSTIIMSGCWPLQGMSPAQKSVLISLADQANDDGVCWPSVKHIAMRTCLSERSVQASIKWLVAAGALAVQERNGRSTVYIVTPAAFAPPQEMRPAPAAPTPANNVKTPAATAPAPANAAPITIITRNRTAKESSAAEKLTLPAWLDIEAWAMWDRFRKQKGAKAWTDDAKRLSLKTLEKLREGGNDPTEVIEQSIERGYTGLFAVKTPGAHQISGVPTLNRQEALEAKNQRVAEAWAAKMQGGGL